MRRRMRRTRTRKTGGETLGRRMRQKHLKRKPCEIKQTTLKFMARATATETAAAAKTTAIVIATVMAD